jgi:hypothetical protein
MTIRVARHTLAFPFVILAIVFAFLSAGMEGLASWIAPRDQTNSNAY